MEAWPWLQKTETGWTVLTIRADWPFLEGRLKRDRR